MKHLTHFVNNIGLRNGANRQGCVEEQCIYASSGWVIDIVDVDTRRRASSATPPRELQLAKGTVPDRRILPGRVGAGVGVGVVNIMARGKAIS
jgi:hypothetical protein